MKAKLKMERFQTGPGGNVSQRVELEGFSLEHDNVANFYPCGNQPLGYLVNFLV